MDVVDGFESMYGMELLATVHWATAEEPRAATDTGRTVELVHDWSPRKKSMFTDEHIRVAWAALRDHGLTSTGV